jgi:bcr-type benzoyl-CoA reductase subunit B
MRDLGAPFLMSMYGTKKSKRSHRTDAYFNPPLDCTRRLKEIMARHYVLARYAVGAKPLAWVTSGAPVELLRAFDFYTVYPENHGALCGARKLGSELCAVAEGAGYDQHLCSYARIDLGHTFSGKTPVGKLPRPDLLFASNNICQTVIHWYRVLAHHWKIPFLLFDTPYNVEEITDSDISYMVRQLEEMIPQLENLSGRRFDYRRFQQILRTSRETSRTWGEALATMQERPAPMTIFEAFGHLAPIVSLRGLPVALAYYQTLLEELKARVDRAVGGLKCERKRLMWDNIPIWYKMRDLSYRFAGHGLNFVAAPYTDAWADTALTIDETRPFESIAKTYSLVILNNNLSHRLNLMHRLIKDYQVDGVVMHSARSCKPYSVGQYDLKRLLSARLGIPSVIIEADIADSRVFSEEPTHTRLSAFIEALENWEAGQHMVR